MTQSHTPARCSNDIRALFATHDGMALVSLVRNGEISAGELLEAAIANVMSVNPDLNAVAEMLEDTARQEAARVSASASVLSGVPTLVKDLFTPVRGARMSCGSRAFGEFRPPVDAEWVARVRAAGIPIIGTTTSPEFGISYCTTSARFGRTVNPWSPAITAGGSSGGAAALVAARAIPFAHGNDGGGSLRVPAACCGVFGLKPTRGRTPMGPMAGEGWAGMGISHAITRSVRDSAALLDITAGMDVGAPYAAPGPEGSFLDALRRPPGPLRIGLIEAAPPWPTESECKAALGYSADVCVELGHSVERLPCPVDADEFYDRVFTIIGAQTRALLEEIARQRQQPVSEQEIEPRTRVVLRAKGDVSGADYAAAVNWIHALGRSFGTLMQRYDVLLTPTVARVPPDPRELEVADDTMPLDEFIHRSHGFSPFTAWFNATGQPAMSVPTYWTAHGVPIGSHFAAGFGREALLFGLAAQLEAGCPWANRIPPIRGA